MASTQTNEQAARLMESGSLAVQYGKGAEASAGAHCTAEIHRGMLVQTSEGNTVGRVAAVVQEQEERAITHILLMRERKLLEYRLVPIELIEQVGEEAILLHIFQSVVESLPIWHGV